MRPTPTLLLLTLTLWVSAAVWGQAPTLTRRVLAMGTTLELSLGGINPEVVQAASERAIEEVARVEAGISTWRPDSAFSQFNRTQGQPVALEAEWLALLEAAQMQAARTGGAFDPCLGTLLEAWQVREGLRPPGRAAWRRARARSGSHLLALDPRQGQARWLRAGARVEEGGFGKGYALDRAAHILENAGVTSALLDFGGQLLVLGGSRTVSIADPQNRSRARVSLQLAQGSLSSSGTSERGAHILDPRTGRPCRAWGSVAVIAPTAFEADCLSTALYVMGPVEGLRWASAQGLPACFLLRNGALRMSPTFRALSPVIHQESPCRTD